jgi:hypothetical protein
MHQNDYAALLEVSGDWARVNLGVGNLGLPVQGWVQQYFEINTDGACAALGTPTSQEVAMSSPHPNHKPLSIGSSAHRLSAPCWLLWKCIVSAANLTS